MSFLAGLKVFGMDIEKAFAWFGSPKGESVIATGEQVIETALPASTPIVDLFNEWAQKAYNVESLAVAAGQGTGTGVEKAALVTTAITPTVLAYAQQVGLPAPTAAQIQSANNALVSFINAMTNAPTTPAA